MERIKEALSKAKASSHRSAIDRETPADVTSPPALQSPPFSGIDPAFLNIPQVQLNASLLEKNRIVAYQMDDSSHVVFNILRTKVYKMMTDNGWKSIAISSPNPRAGKTTVAINLAFSLARQKNCRVVLVDMDLRRPAISKMLGIEAGVSIGQYLLGHVDIQQCFVQAAENLVLVPNDQPTKISSEMMLNQWGREIGRRISDVLAPDVIIFDLPPMLASDDAMGFLPYVDCGLLVVDDGGSKYKQVDLCGKQFASATNFIGHVLNKSTEKVDTGYNYYGS